MSFDLYFADDENGGEFHRNNAGWREVIDMLWNAQVINPTSSHAPWPTREQFGIPADDHYPDDDEEVTDPRWLAFIAANDAVLSDPLPGDQCGIPLYKLGSNDGWHVQPGEIRTGFARADASFPGWRDDLIGRTAEAVAFFEAAADHEGFKVY